ncbi:MAG: adenylate/guanylate cyclase domain-containing protein [Limnospira sp.]
MTSKLLSELVRLLRARLSRRITFWIATSIVLIEAIILIPSVYRRQQELLAQYHRLSSGKIAWIVATYPHQSPADFLEQLRNLHRMNPDVVGGTLYTSDGELIGIFGEPPALSFEAAREGQRLYLQTLQGDRYDLACDVFPLDDYTIILRHDASDVSREVWYFVLRIAGLVLIISVFVTGATMIVLNYLVILPILNLREDLTQAGEALSGNRPPPQFYSHSVHRRDELGEVIGAFIQMYDRVGQAIAQQHQAEEALRLEKEKSETLLLNILPDLIADRLKQTPGCIADGFAQATILFADITDFTGLSSQVSPTELVNLLNQIFSAFDRLTDKYGLEKIKTIGDAYMVVGGIPTPRPDHAEAIADLALEMQRVVREFRHQLDRGFDIRIGINTGPVVAGVIGLKKFTYDLWGDAVNVASRMESQGEAGKIQVGEPTYRLLGDRYVLEKRGIIPIKGKGNMTTYWLISKGDPNS